MDEHAARAAGRAPDRAIGFVGFGEAGSRIAAGLVAAGATPVLAHDPDARRAAVRAAEAGVGFVPSASGLAARCDLLVSTVTCDVALPVARAMAAHLGADHLWLDLNSTSPDTKRAIGEAIGASGARFVEGAVMTAVAPLGHRAPILVCGEAAPALVERLAPFGMALEDYGREIGRASATKMFRSIVVKGLEALLLECALAASPYGVTRRVLDYVEEGYPGLDWNGLADRLLARTAVHGERRAHELEEVAATLRALGIEPLMAQAGARRLGSVARLGLAGRLRDAAPRSGVEVLGAIEAAGGVAAPAPGDVDPTG